MRCSKCGRENLEKSSFCSACGHPIGGSPLQAAGTTKQPSDRRSSTTLIAVIVVIVIVIMIIGFAAYVGMRAVDNITTTEVTISVVDATEVIDPFWSPPDGTTFIQLIITMTNNEKSTITLSPYNFEIVTNDGGSYDYAWQIDNTVPDSLAGKSTTTFSIAFAVPADKIPTKVTYQGLFDLNLVESAIDSVNPAVIKVTLTVTGATAADGIYSPDEGNMYLLIEFEMTNGYNETLSLSPYDFGLQTTSGAIYDYSWGVEYDVPGGLAAGAVASMSLGFEIPATATPQKLIYEHGNLNVEAVVMG